MSFLFNHYFFCSLKHVFETSVSIFIIPSESCDCYKIIKPSKEFYSVKSVRIWSYSDPRIQETQPKTFAVWLDAI